MKLSLTVASRESRSRSAEWSRSLQAALSWTIDLATPSETRSTAQVISYGSLPAQPTVRDRRVASAAFGTAVDMW